MQVKYIVITQGGHYFKIAYLERDFAKDHEELFIKRGVPLSDVKYLVAVDTINGRKYPVVDIHAPEKYKEKALIHEYFCTIDHDHDKEFKIRRGKNHCADVERLVLDSLQGGDKTTFIRQRKTMFSTVINYGLSDAATIEKMVATLNFLKYQK
ncbi:hypothetical protein IK110_02215 [Candidatus Saccharibacteria bacterium]|nr:hypothetical protein [Candidatus Saccharibacteria bacterium]